MVMSYSDNVRLLKLVLIKKGGMNIYTVTINLFDIFVLFQPLYIVYFLQHMNWNMMLTLAEMIS